MLRRFVVGAVIALFASSLLSSCYLPAALSRSRRMVRDGFDVGRRGAWVLVTGPGSLLAAGGYRGEILPVEAVAILCGRERATRIERIRRAGGSWVAARHEKWHVPRCIEVLPGRYELEVHYFLRETEGGRERVVTRQAESTEPSLVEWNADAGGLYLLSAALGPPAPASGTPPRRHIPRSRSLGTSWWELETSEWTARIERLPSWESVDEPLREHRRVWIEYERRRR
jgi:hypothetical protein